MKYSIHIDQVHAIEWKLNASEAIAFSFCYGLSAWAELIQTDGEIYYFASRTKAIEEYPLISDKPDTIYRLYRSLESKGLIKYRKFSGKDLIQLTTKGKKWNSENFPNAAMNSEKNPNMTKRSENFPNKLGKKSESDSENFPTYNNTILDTITNNKESESEKNPPPIKSANYLSETKPFDPEPTAEKSELIFLNASKKIKEHFRNYPDDWTLICDVAKKKLSPARFAEELDKWLSRNVENLMLMQNPSARLKRGESSFVSWIAKPWVTEVEQNQNQNQRHGNGNSATEQRYNANQATVAAIIEKDLREAGMLDQLGKFRN